MWVLLMLALPVAAGVQCAQHKHPHPAAESVVAPLLHAFTDSAPAGLIHPKTIPAVPHESEYTGNILSHSHCADHGHTQCTACCAVVVASSWSASWQNPRQPWLAGRIADFAGRHPPPETKPPSSSSPVKS